MRSYRIATIVALSFIYTAAQTRADVRVQYDLVPPRTLPGVPVSHRVTVINDTSEAVTVEKAVLLLIEPDGQRRSPDTGSTNGPFAFQFGWPEDLLVVPAGRKSEMWFPISSSLHTSVEFYDSRLVTAGIVPLQLLVTTSQGEVESNVAELEIEEPSGDDLAVWNLMKQHGRGSWPVGCWGSCHVGKFWRTVFESYPSSRYLPYFGGHIYGMPAVDRIVYMDQAIRASEGLIIGEVLKLDKGHIYRVASDSALHGQANVDRAIEYAHNARDVLEELIRTTPYPFVREQAQSELAQVSSDVQIRGMYKFLFQNDPRPLRVTPVLQCVAARPDGTFMAVFGYNNPNKRNKAIDVGSGNKITPAPYDRGQPRHFLPGSHADAFRITGTGELAWTLDGTTVTASSKHKLGCPE